MIVVSEFSNLAHQLSKISPRKKVVLLIFANLPAVHIVGESAGGGSMALAVGDNDM